MQWDTSEHDWLEGRGPKLYLIHMIDDATSELTARFVDHDSTEENMRLLWTYLERHGRPVAFYTDKASLFRTAPKITRDRQPLPREEREALPSDADWAGAATNSASVWIAAHSPQAKGRVERSFGTAQDRLVKGLRVAGACTLEQANRYLEEEFLPWWNQHLAVPPANPADAHRPLGREHDLAAVAQPGGDAAGRPTTTRFNSTTASIRSSAKRLVPDCAAQACMSSGGWTAHWPSASATAYLAVRACCGTAQAGIAGHRFRAGRSRARKRKPPSPPPALRAAISTLFRPPGLPVWKAARSTARALPTSFD